MFVKAYFFLTLPWSLKKLLFQSFLALLIWNRRLKKWGYEKCVSKIKSSLKNTGQLESSQNIVWAMQAASRRLPFIKCLAIGLAGQWLLLKNGHHSTLRIGVQKEKAFKAHAWLIMDKKIVLGDGTDIEDFYPLVDSSPST